VVPTVGPFHLRNPDRKTDIQFESWGLAASSSGSLATFTAIRRASSRVSRTSVCAVASLPTKLSGFSTIDQGGGKRRLGASSYFVPRSFGASFGGARMDLC
jgi:hypothetical protein